MSTVGRVCKLVQCKMFENMLSVGKLESSQIKAKTKIGKTFIIDNNL